MSSWTLISKLLTNIKTDFFQLLINFVVGGASVICHSRSLDLQQAYALIQPELICHRPYTLKMIIQQ